MKTFFRNKVIFCVSKKTRKKLFKFTLAFASCVFLISSVQFGVLAQVSGPTGVNLKNEAYLLNFRR